MSKQVEDSFKFLWPFQNVWTLPDLYESFKSKTAILQKKNKKYIVKTLVKARNSEKATISEL